MLSSSASTIPDESNEKEASQSGVSHKQPCPQQDEERGVRPVRELAHHHDDDNNENMDMLVDQSKKGSIQSSPAPVPITVPALDSVERELTLQSNDTMSGSCHENDSGNSRKEISNENVPTSASSVPMANQPSSLSVQQVHVFDIMQKLGSVFAWTKQDDERLLQILKTHPPSKNARNVWTTIAQEFGNIDDHKNENENGSGNESSDAKNVTARECFQRWTLYLAPPRKNLHKKRFTVEEDAIITHSVQSAHPAKPCWTDICKLLASYHNHAKKSEQLHTHTSTHNQNKKEQSRCADMYSPHRIRERWNTCLNPKLNKMPFSKDEEVRLYEGLREHGQKWTAISKDFFDGTRSDIQLKNRFKTVSFQQFYGKVSARALMRERDLTASASIVHVSAGAGADRGTKGVGVAAAAAGVDSVGPCAVTGNGIIDMNLGVIADDEGNNTNIKVHSEQHPHELSHSHTSVEINLEIEAIGDVEIGDIEEHDNELTSTDAVTEIRNHSTTKRALESETETAPALTTTIEGFEENDNEPTSTGALNEIQNRSTTKCALESETKTVPAITTAIEGIEEHVTEIRNRSTTKRVLEPETETAPAITTTTKMTATRTSVVTEIRNRGATKRSLESETERALATTTTTTTTTTQRVPDLHKIGLESSISNPIAKRLKNSLAAQVQAEEIPKPPPGQYFTPTGAAQILSRIGKSERRTVMIAWIDHNYVPVNLTSLYRTLGRYNSGKKLKPRWYCEGRMKEGSA